jgi:hypothetical protein
VAVGSNDVDEIYHRMAVIRREHHTNVRESVADSFRRSRKQLMLNLAWVRTVLVTSARTRASFVITDGNRARVFSSGSLSLKRNPRREPVSHRQIP